MAHFAEIDSNNIVLRVVTVADEVAPVGQAYLADHMGLGGTWIQTSYNNNMRKQFAGIGYTYDPVADVFIAPQPFPSWTLDANHDWQPPTPTPTDGKMYRWDETTLTWKVI